MVEVVHVSVMLLINVHNNASKFARVTNRITKMAKRRRKPSRVPVKIFMKARKKRKKSQEAFKAFVKSHFSIM